MNYKNNKNKSRLSVWASLYYSLVKSADETINEYGVRWGDSESSDTELLGGFDSTNSLFSVFEDEDDEDVGEDDFWDNSEFFEEFNLDKLKKLTKEDPKEASEYIGDHLIEVATGRGGGIGSSRIVYHVGPSEVLKMAYNPAGVYQNGMEARISGRNPLLSKVYDIGDRYLWIISEKVTPINEGQFYAETGLTRDIISDPFFRSSIIRLTPDLLEQLRIRFDFEPDTLEFIQNAHKLIRDFDVIPGDSLNPDHWGLSSSGGIRLYDYGLDSSGFGRFYNSSGRLREVPLGYVEKGPNSSFITDTVDMDEEIRSGKNKTNRTLKELVENENTVLNPDFKPFTAKR